jgi:hypothetical protein
METLYNDSIIFPPHRTEIIIVEIVSEIQECLRMNIDQRADRSEAI